MSRSRAEEYFRPSAEANELGSKTFGFVLALGATAPVLALSGVLGLADESSHSAVMLAVAAAFAVFASTVLRRRPWPSELRRVHTLNGAVVALATLGLVSTMIYLLTGAFNRFDDALYESVAGVSTSSLTVLADPSVLSDAQLIWRSGTQWLGGLLGLSLGVGLLPFLGGSRELADPRDRRTVSQALASRPVAALKRVLSIYSLVTVVVAAALFAAGMGAIDGTAHALSSVSTGGFSTEVGSVGSYNSVAIELATIVVMAGAGSSVALVWMLWRRQFSDTRRSFELRVVALVTVVATSWVLVARPNSGHGFWRDLLDSLFTVVSLGTTTGHHVDDWASWQPGLVMLLLILLAIGGMAGSVAGGLRWIRAVTLVSFVWRELQRQLHPNSVRVVKVGQSAISEASVDRIHAQLVFVSSACACGAILLGFAGLGVVEALSLALSALSTAGPGVSDSGTIVNASELSRGARLVLMPMMFAGRVFLYPALVFVGSLWFSGERSISARSRRVRPSQPAKVRR